MIQDMSHKISSINQNTNRLRILSIITIIWHAFIFNIHLLTFNNQAIFNLNLISYTTIAFIGILTLVFPNIAKANFASLFIPLYIGQQLLYFLIPFRDFSLTQAIIDGAVLLISFWLIQKLGLYILQAESNLQNYILEENNHILPLSVVQKRIKEELEEVQQNNQFMAFIYCQIYINETIVDTATASYFFLENEINDRLKRRYSQVKLTRSIMHLIYSSDIVFEYLSGIMVCLPETNKEHAQKFLDQLSGFTNAEENITLWAGISIFPLDSSSSDELIKNAKNNMELYIPKEEEANAAPRPGDVSVTISDRMRIAKKSEWVDKLAYQSKVSRAIYKPIKRLIDIVIVGTGLIVISPLLLCIAIAVLIDDGWPIFYSHKRVGLGGKTFMMHKFRSMYKNTKALKPIEVKLNDGTIRYDWPEKNEDDPRITRTGRFLRRTSLDELPQLLNVLIGNMSLIGPRPSSWTLDQHTLHQTARLTVKPGITGLWQVSARSSKNFDERLLWDLMYVEKMGLWLDIRILLMTFQAVVKRSGV